MNEEKAGQNEQFLREAARQLRMAQVEATLETDDLIHTAWNGRPLCTVDANGTARFSPDDIFGTDEDRQLQTVTQTVAQVKEYLRIMEHAPALKAVDLDENYKILAEFDDIVLAGRMSKNGVRFVTWEYDFDRRGVHAGHYFMQLYESAKQDFAVRAGLVNRQRLFSDEQLAVIQNACEFSLEDDITLSYAEEKLLRSVQKQIEQLLLYFPIASLLLLVNSFVPALAVCLLCNQKERTKPMADKRNLCAMIPADLHARVRQEQDASGKTLSEFVEQLITDYYNMKEGTKMTGDMRTMAIQLPEELFERLKAYLKKNNLKQKQFIISLIEDALEQDEETATADESQTEA